MTPDERKAARARCEAAKQVTTGPWIFLVIAHDDLPAALLEIDRLEALLRRHGIDPTERP
jgi:hypothetical protein